jgi:hypothetical protein
MEAGGTLVFPLYLLFLHEFCHDPTPPPSPQLAKGNIKTSCLVCFSYHTVNLNTFEDIFMLHKTY